MGVLSVQTVLLVLFHLLKAALFKSARLILCMITSVGSRVLVSVFCGLGTLFRFLGRE